MVVVVNTSNIDYRLHLCGCWGEKQCIVDHFECCNQDGESGSYQDCSCHHRDLVGGVGCAVNPLHCYCYRAEFDVVDLLLPRH